METDHTAVERRLLDEALAPGAVALDAGCGRTTRLRHYRDRIVRLVGVDADEEAGRANPYLDEFLVADLDDALPFPDGAFDLVYANFVVEHLGRPERAFAEWRRVLRPGGTLLLLTSNRASPLMAAADRLPERLRLYVKRRGAGAVARDVYPTRYLANTPARLEATARAAGFEPRAVVLVGTLHRYGARLPGVAAVLRALERLLPERRRSTIVAAFR
ncbi:MAG TPA: class I SAM-dependent methyltransferase [Gaiellaceae bacterium]|nr:class I SAM-dependent methyltransferase [Gaiellaceae bacterium]